MAEYYCNICEVHVIEDSKHCQLCNRCSYEFDHHCRWVSNDIGRLNYIIFIRMLICVAFTLIIQVCFCIFVVKICNDAIDNKLNDVNYLGLNILNYVTLGLVALFLILVLYLICFHFHLMRQNMTTLKYLRRKQTKNRQSRVITKIGA